MQRNQFLLSDDPEPIPNRTGRAPETRGKVLRSQAVCSERNVNLPGHRNEINRTRMPAFAAADGVVSDSLVLGNAS